MKKSGTLEQIINAVKDEKLFEMTTEDGSFTVKINKYVPFCCTAIHSGSNLRPELKNKIALNKYERWYEEDPFTDDFIEAMPLTIICHDSRYEYDLNRSPEKCIYDEAWGKKVWKKKLSPSEIKKSLQKHAAYYLVLDAIICKLEEMFGGAVVYDLHSYNYKRWEREVPLFNIGTEKIDRNRFAPVVENWLSLLSGIKLTDTENKTAENDVFFGRGYNLEYISNRFKNTLVLATEVKKVYCNELTGDSFPALIQELQQELKEAILSNANFFSQRLEKWKHRTTYHLLDKSLNEKLLEIDNEIYRQLKDFELLAVVNPKNTAAERARFFKNKSTELPKFEYNPVKIDPFSLKKKLLSIDLDSIQDISIREMYQSVVDSYFDKIDMVSSLNSQKFLYNSLRYFGRPSQKDLKNAFYILSLPDLPEDLKSEPMYDANAAMEAFRIALNEYGVEAKVELSSIVIARVMVLNSSRKILFQPAATFKSKDIQALIEHEIGVHMLTTINSDHQKLKLFNVGLPLNTHTQEGMAILAEYLSGNITLERLKKIALRVVIIDAMCNGADFIECYNLLVKEYKEDPNEAFSSVTRIFRGGGFTKDYLYLSGFAQIFDFWKSKKDIGPLMIGKTSLEFYDTIQEMIGREMIAAPSYLPKSFANPKIENNNPIYQYILSGIR